MAPKTYPSNWTTRQVSYFAGMLSSLIPFGELKQVVDECAGKFENALADDLRHQLYFVDLVTQLEPRISADQWAACVENCSKIFGGSTHAK